MKELFRNKKIFIYSLIMLSALYLIRRFLYAGVLFEDVSFWIRATLRLSFEIILMISLLLFVFFDKEKGYRIGLIISVISLTISRFEADVNYLLFSVVSFWVFTSIKLYQKQKKTQVDYLKYYLTVILLLCYYLFKLNLGNKSFILIFHIFSILSLISLAFIYLKFFLPNTELLKKEIGYRKITFREVLIHLGVILFSTSTAVLFDIFLSYKIIDYKFDRFVKNSIEYYENKHSNFQSAYKHFRTLPTLPYIEIHPNNISIEIQDTTLNDSDRIVPIFEHINPESTVYRFEYNNEFSLIKNIDFIDSNHLEISYSDTTFIFKWQWVIAGVKMNNSDPHIGKMLNYLDLNEYDLNKIKDILYNIGCSGISKDIYGNIYLTVDIGGFDRSGYVFLRSENQNQPNMGILKKLEDNVYWFYYEGCCIEFWGSYYMNRYNI